MSHRAWPRRAVQVVGSWAIALLLALTVLLPAPEAAAAPTEASLGDVLSSLSIVAQPTDYIVIVDTSASMVDQGRYQLVKSALARMAKALRPDDRVAVITFDTGPTVRRPLTNVGSQPDSIVSSLPGTPNGQGTDIGGAINAALNLMEAAKLRSRAAVLLLTDGKIDTPPTSPFATITSSGWAGLHRRAAALQGSHDIAPLAIALTSNTDAAVLQQVFSNVIDVPATNLGTYLSQVSTTVMKASAAKKLQPDIAKPVAASLEGLSSAPSSKPITVTITLNNADALVPVVVSGLGIESTPSSKVSVVGAPSTLEIPAGGTKSVSVQLTGAITPGTTTSYRVVGTVTSPWRKVIVDDLGLAWKPALTSAAVAVGQPAATASATAVPAAAPTAPTAGWVRPLTVALGLLALGIVLLVGARALWRASRPPLIGTVSVLRNGKVIEEGLLRGRRMTVELGNPNVSILLTATRNSQKESGVRVHVTSGKNHRDGTLFEADTFEVDDLTITYTTDRTRMLRLIGTD